MIGEAERRVHLQAASEGERGSPSVLHFKEIKGDEYLEHRA
jgi:hypothetical protein